jgi:hypothetical protein
MHEDPERVGINKLARPKPNNKGKVGYSLPLSHSASITYSFVSVFHVETMAKIILCQIISTEVRSTAVSLC